MLDLADILRQRFGHADFRPHQAAACAAVAGGDDVLLVMPTGAGKSLCFQLPAIARGGSALVVSPLISLMEDQVAKLRGQGFKAARIHSGRARAESRQACLDWADGKLDFLYIAPERLRVAGFVEWLAKRKPGLIAIDEAHCISQWGHDFRPDYRLLGSRLHLLRGLGDKGVRHSFGELPPKLSQTPGELPPELSQTPPVIALTATATPLVQRDITEQLGMTGAQRLIHGFRRENLAVEICETAPGLRAGKVRGLLADGARLPAIVYVPSRKECDALAQELASLAPCLPYHAGLDADAREKAQAGFMAGGAHIVVATIAFGMGIDKHDIRTVIHTALPQSVEGYYQEIGRAGRDGKPSRAILMYSWADRRLHEFFIGRDYPPMPDMKRMFGALGARGVSLDGLCAYLDLGEQDAESGVDKLVGLGAAEIDEQGFITRGRDDWQAAYQRRVDHRMEQLEKVFAFAQGRTCRMCALVRHFGDIEDATRPCGNCDICDAAGCALKRTREPEAEEKVNLKKILDALRARDDVSTGKLHRETFNEADLPRREFEVLMAGLEQAGLVETVEDQFEKDGQVINYRRARLTDAGRKPTAGKVMLPVIEQAKSKSKKSSKKASKEGEPASRAGVAARLAAPQADPKLVEALKQWRKQQAAAMGVPAFHVLSNKVLEAVAAHRPKTADELTNVPGIGPGKLKQFGDAILGIMGTDGNGVAAKTPSSAKRNR